MSLTGYTLSRRFGLLWVWTITEGLGAPASGLALTRASARWAARTRIRNAKLLAAIPRRDRHEAPHVEDDGEAVDLWSGTRPEREL